MHTKYIVLEELSLDNLQSEVEKKLKNGWSLVGGIAVSKQFYLQALAK